MITRPPVGAALLALVSSTLPLTAFAGDTPRKPASPYTSGIATPAGSEQARKVAETFAGRGVQRDDTPPTPAAQALGTFTVREGFALDPMASEPDVLQPLYMSWDSKGRLWVVEYLQYQFPAGLKVISYDQHLRAQFDKVPEPPPRGVRGADRITVFEPSPGNGPFTKHRTVLDGLNLVTSALKGAGGIWVLNPPYLLFYPDANDDDVPDSHPEVALSGFGMEDTHAMANSLRWGPDGWLYGANGSTTTANVSSAVSKNIRFQGQHVWRFHPKTKIFEVYAEGGGNTFSTEIDAQGRFFSGTNAEKRGMHYDQGMSGVKSFGKHGPPLNPYSFGFFDHLETKGDGKRFSQAFAIYEGGAMPQLHGRILAANSLQNLCYVSQLIPSTSTFRTEDDPLLLKSSDRWFRPVDVKVGPDGCIYFADWYDTRLSHVRPVDDWSKSDGRLYRVRPKDHTPDPGPFNLHTAPVEDLLKNLSHENKWFRLQSALELNWRGETSALPQLEKLARDPANPRALDALFALHMLGGLHDTLSQELLHHPNPFVRRWVIRCIGDSAEASPGQSNALARLAAEETHPEVKTQLLASAKRLPAPTALPILRSMMEREADLADQRIPLLLWWAIEARAESEREPLLALLESESPWHSKLARTYFIQFLAKRYAMAGGSSNLGACERMYALARTPEDKSLVVEGIISAFEGAKLPPLPSALADAIQAHLKRQTDGNLSLGVKAGNPEATEKALAVLREKKGSTANKIALLEAFADSANPAVVPVLLSFITSSSETGLKKAALSVAPRFDHPKIAPAIVSAYESKLAGDSSVRDAAHRALASRKDWALSLISELDSTRIKTAHIAPEIRQQLAAHGDPEINKRLEQWWPSAASKISSTEKLAESTRIKTALQAGHGDLAKGRQLFDQRCAACHTLFEQGGKIGPDLTGYERQNLDFWLPSILEPSLEIREGYGSYVAKLKDGQLRMGLLEKQDAVSVVLKDLAGSKTTLPLSDVTSLEASPVSIMPEGLLLGLSDSDLRDLFAYLQKP